MSRTNVVILCSIIYLIGFILVDALNFNVMWTYLVGYVIGLVAMAIITWASEDARQEKL